MANIELQGVDELMNKVNRLGKKGTRIENRALKNAGSVVKKAIKEEAPVKTGRLRENINTSGIRTKEGIKHVAIGPGSDAFYAVFIEFGTVHIRANPFMSRGYERSKGEAMNKISEELRRGLGL